MAAALLCAGVAAAQPAEPPDYRMGAYRAPTPATLAGATVVDASEAERLWREGETVFVDVLPRPPRPEGLPDDVVWRDKPRDSIPGAVWIPNVGFGALATPMDSYFRSALAEAAGGDTSTPVLFYCLADCWMSWNAAKRALTEYGYENVYWFPEGTDAWSAAGLPLERVEPAAAP